MVDSEDFDTRFVTLPRLIMPARAHLLAIALEARGFHLRREGNDVLVVSPTRAADP